MKNFLLALQFLTRIPVKIKGKVKESDLPHSVTYFPLVGLLLGLILVSIDYVFSLVFVPFISVILTFIIYLLLTGSLHLDGFADTVDGLYGGKTREEIFKIMKDSSIGSIGAVWLFILLMFKIGLLIYLKFIGLKTFTLALVIMPVLSRFGISLQMYLAPYAKEKGAGKSFCKKVSFLELCVNLIFTVLISIFFGLQGFVAFLMVFGGSLLITVYFIKKLKGVSGDVFGFTLEILEIYTLIVLTV